MNWKTAFQASTTNVAFNLSLSRRMVEMLVIAKAYHDRKDTWHMNSHGHFITSMKCLRARGLVEHHDIAGNRSADHRWFTLTPAGLCVYELCVMAGLIQSTEHDEAANDFTQQAVQS